MLYKYRFIVYLFLLAILIILTGVVVHIIFKPKASVMLNLKEETLNYIQGNSLMAYSSPYTPKFQVLGMEVSQKLYFIVKCESDFDPKAINKTYGKSGGQGLCQFIPKTWADTIKRMGDLLPEECQTTEAVFDGKCNLLACEWLLNADGDIHWKPYSGYCWLKYL